MSRIPIALQLYSVRNDLKEDFINTLRTVKELGYEGVEFFGDFVHTAQEVADALKETDLVCCGWHTPWEYVQDDKIDATIEYNKIIGNKYIIVPGLPSECTSSKDAWLESAKKFNEIQEKLSKHDMVTGYHNHAIEFKLIDGERPWDILFGNTCKDIVMQLDMGNALSGGGDVVEILKQHPGRAGTVHLKPYSLEGGFDPIIGSDDIPWKEVFALCRETGDTKWYIVEYESENVHKPLDGVKLCMDALKKMEAEGIMG